MRWFSLILCLTLFQLGCGTAVSNTATLTTNSDNSNTSPLEGRILVWHGWDGREAAVLESQIATFRRLHPNVTIAVVQVPPGDILGRYIETAQLGLGPDLLVGKSEWLNDLIVYQVVQDISAEANTANSRYVPSTLERLRDGTAIYGLPLTMRPPALYYNTHLVQKPANTLEDLLQQATDGHVVALSTRAASAYWGMATFGPPLFVGGTLSADAGGLEKWLDWLKRAQDNPNVILSQDDASLEQLFAAGRASYYVGSVDLWYGFQEALRDPETGQGGVGVAPLPAGTLNGRPLLEVDALFFNPASSDRQSALAHQLADFLTNAEQGNVLMRELGRVPANQRVRVNSRLYPEIAVFAQQGRLAANLPRPVRPLVLGDLGNGVYTAVLSGARTTQGAVCEYTQTIRQSFTNSEPDFSQCGE